ncbi:unnamed protein product [Protopolystoma xenopodis]|uniref:Uncharacterized protein n=1 Tax=Protopolystoma xenopodis TaxID=117903 RepID=A0A3S5CEI3_9PLAT|nr:unnamed protein product [Protopolystoma xenopodis]
MEAMVSKDCDDATCPQHYPSGPSSGPSVLRDPDLRPLIKMSVNLIRTYKNINELQKI